MAEEPNSLLLPVDDGLEMRDSQEYARYKLKALETYISIANTAMRSKPWIDRYYIDLMAGPGKNRIGNEVLLGSPLLALTVVHPFTQYRLNEADKNLSNALQRRVDASQLREQIRVTTDNANEIVHQICDEIQKRDRQSRYPETYNTFNIAFLDPEGLELEWSTVERLAKIPKMDLIINFSTSGLFRVIGAGGEKNLALIDRFYGNQSWRELSLSSDAVSKRRQLIQHYLGQLERFGYNVETDPEIPYHDMSFRNSRNAEVYSLIFASKHELGDKFWRQARTSSSPPRLPGF